MSGILAIEPDGQRRALLTGFLREHAQVDVTIVSSVSEAIARFEEYQPDLIMAPTLLSPVESDRLRSHVKRYADPHVQMLTLPALDLLREAPAEDRGSWFRRRRSTSPALPYDPVMAGRQVAERLQLARQLRQQPASTLDIRSLMQADEPTAARAQSTVSVMGSAASHERRRAERTPQRSPWVWTVRMPWGGDVELVNISRSGILIESGSMVSPGVALDLHLGARGASRIVTARFVRSEVARVDGPGVRYRSAAQFEEPLDIVPSRTIASRATPQSLEELVTAVLSDSNRLGSPAARFARGLQELLGVRDVLIRCTPMRPPADSDSIYFNVKQDGVSRTILQVMFDRPPTAAEFSLLKAAAALTTTVLELEGRVDDQARAANVA